MENVSDWPGSSFLRLWALRMFRQGSSIYKFSFWELAAWKERTLALGLMCPPATNMGRAITAGAYFWHGSDIREHLQIEP